MLSDQVLQTLITTIGTSIVSIVVAVSGRKTRNRLVDMAKKQNEIGEDTKHVKREMQRRNSGELAAITDVPVANKPQLGDIEDAASQEGSDEERRAKRR